MGILCYYFEWKEKWYHTNIAFCILQVERKFIYCRAIKIDHLPAWSTFEIKLPLKSAIKAANYSANPNTLGPRGVQISESSVY